MEVAVVRQKAVDIVHSYLTIHFPRCAKKFRKEAGITKHLFSEPETLEKLCGWYLDLQAHPPQKGKVAWSATRPPNVAGEPSGSEWSFEPSSEDDVLPENLMQIGRESSLEPPAAESYMVEPIASDATVAVTAPKHAKKDSKSKKRKADILITETAALDGPRDVPEPAAQQQPPLLGVSGLKNGEKRHKEKASHEAKRPFRRVRAEEVTFADERLRDNGFMARGAEQNDYGARAHRDLIVTKGEGFRKEKQKKKRGSYRGGEISMESKSIKFT